MNLSNLEKIINKAFEDKQSINEKSDNEILSAICQKVLILLGMTRFQESQ